MALNTPLLATLWHTGADATATARGQALITEYVSRLRAAYERLPFRTVWTPADPFTTFEAMRDAVRSTGVMPVWMGASEIPMWDALTNWQARAVHDADHLSIGADFGMAGEVVAYRVAAQRCPALAPLLMSEIILQAAAANMAGAFGPQKLVLLSDPMLRLSEQACGL